MAKVYASVSISDENKKAMKQISEHIESHTGMKNISFDQTLSNVIAVYWTSIKKLERQVTQ